MKNTKNKSMMNEKTTLMRDQLALFENEGNFVKEKNVITIEKKGCRCVQNVHKKNVDELIDKKQ